jgi:hypothetical protein
MASEIVQAGFKGHLSLMQSISKQCVRTITDGAGGANGRWSLPPAKIYKWIFAISMKSF